jgi:2-iminobutanoate/2-iminopropanoate deaminase
MRREPVTTDGAPRALGPYTQAIRSSGETLVFCSGQVGLDPATGDLVSGGITAETRQALRNLGAVLDAAGTSLAFVVKTTVFLADMGDFAAMNAVYGDFFPAPHPARSTVQVARLPKDARVEVEAIATAPSRDA